MKTPLFRLQYELEQSYSEQGADTGAKLLADRVDDPAVKQCLEVVRRKPLREAVQWMRDEQERGNADLYVLPLTTYTPEALAYRLEGRFPKVLYITRPLHTIKLLDEFLHECNLQLEAGAWICCHATTAVLKRKLLMRRYPWGVNHVVVAAHYLWHRVCPKLHLTRKLYFSVTGGKNRTFNRVEVLGRLYRAGFEVADEQLKQGEFVVIARKEKLPIEDNAPTGSPIIHLRRIGKDGKEIVVHKFRTMYIYSEYIQSYVYRYQNLDSGGKFKDDYRVNFWGKVLRKTWLDELPMVWNILRGDMKLVGVRPLSPHYFSLYTPEMQALRTRTKPGLLPPFYYDKHTPETLEEIQASEQRYLEAYLKAPRRTDWRYFWGIVGNILFRRKRSK